METNEQRIASDSISKKAAAVEVHKWVKQKRAMEIINIVGLFALIFTTAIGMIAMTLIVAIVTGINIFMLLRDQRELKYLEQTYLGDFYGTSQKPEENHSQ